MSDWSFLSNICMISSTFLLLLFQNNSQFSAETQNWTRVNTKHYRQFLFCYYKIVYYKNLLNRNLTKDLKCT